MPETSPRVKRRSSRPSRCRSELRCMVVPFGVLEYRRSPDDLPPDRDLDEEHP
jgi:hypothetical protein